MAGTSPCNWGDTDEVLLQKGAVENRCISIPNNLQKEGTENSVFFVGIFENSMHVDVITHETE